MAVCVFWLSSQGLSVIIPPRPFDHRRHRGCIQLAALIPR